MPKDIVAKLAADVIAVLQMPDVRERLLANGVDPIGASPEQTALKMRAESDKWSKIIVAAKIKPD